MFTDTLETDSLVLQQFGRDHVDVFELYDLFAESREDVADVFEYVPQEPYATVKEAHEQLTEAESKWSDHEAAQYAVYTADGELAGYTGLFLEWPRRTGRIGFILGKPYWGNGYAGECATALTELAFERLDLEVVAIGYEDGNERSQRALEKFIERVGGQYEGCLRNWTPIGDDVEDHHRYTVTRAEFQQARNHT
ncbi:GNAT family N-acetyltransferase [Natronobacterium gregoryi]|uniref:Acetyltransferase including N-acetylase of ribosomal protein-like protein n=2 Tax=Natronobacterium gregoryi TaxID=44930 RepID=L0AGB7_NATGS|nr:GNAT family protein [Natronobacterium gregoryi]AFZ72197.1 acetyltransferase, ribosomal protein N-acetylase [Natronobacterium gregoryi SP2]ELY63201.1 Acetyltransferase including N-acetylase of ribosomal protein-like protein [Natronobacterium gregoryi SP2]PLK20141.1 N-acetyltransferase [Natronobacterium gregoryi SP2]SFJ32311.1 Protein N-acetyltransferase, RimJ/RimL family [Natronobacterium gregoryi]